MSNWPDFLPTTRPANSIFSSGEQLSAEEINQLHQQIKVLHFRPIVVVLPKHFEVGNPDALLSEISKAWHMGPHGMLIVYAPVGKNVWSVCGTFNKSAGVEPAFFKRDFLQRMSMDSREGNLAAALNSSLQDVDSVVVRSQAFASRAVTQQVNHAAGNHVHHNQGFPFGTILFAICAAVCVLFVIKRVGASAGRRVRFDDLPPVNHDLNHDLDRISRVVDGDSQSPYARQGNTTHKQIPMAEFQKRATLSAGRTTSASTDHAAELQSAIDTSAAKFRHEAKLKAVEAPLASVEAISPNYSDASGADRLGDQGYLGGSSAVADQQQHSYSSQFEASGGAASPFLDGPAVPAKDAPNLLNLSPYSAKPDSGSYLMQDADLMPLPNPGTVAGVQLGGSAGLVPAANRAANPANPAASHNEYTSKVYAANLDILGSDSSDPSTADKETLSTKPLSTTPALAPIPTLAPLPPAMSSSDAFNNSFGAVPFANMMSQLGAAPGGPEISSRGLDTSAGGSAGQAGLPCPKCSEPKSKDFSFCLKCGHNF